MRRFISLSGKAQILASEGIAALRIDLADAARAIGIGYHRQRRGSGQNLAGRGGGFGFWLAAAVYRDVLSIFAEK